jgi:hypothetical protein
LLTKLVGSPLYKEAEELPSATAPFGARTDRLPARRAIPTNKYYGIYGIYDYNSAHRERFARTAVGAAHAYNKKSQAWKTTTEGPTPEDMPERK